MSRKAVLFSAIICLTVYVSSGFSSDLEYKPGELLVKFAPKVGGEQRTKDERNAILASISGGTVKRCYHLVPGLTLVKLPENQTVENALPLFRNTDGILYAEPNYKIKRYSVFPNDPNFTQLWGLHNIAQAGGTPDDDIDAPEAWDIHTGSTDVIVAVLDSGVDYNHPDMGANMWVNSGEQPGDWNGDGRPGLAGVDDDGDGLIDEDSNGLEPNDPNYTNDLVNDDDENGYIDDIYGYDFADNDNDPMDPTYDGHGTYCAGIVGATGNNSEGITGVCWNVGIMALKIFPDYGGDSFVNSVIDALQYATNMGVKITSNSWGTGSTDLSGLRDAIEATDANGVLFVAAAGNDDDNNDEGPDYPSSYDLNNIISVMATDVNDDKPFWSNYGANSVDLAAPGENIFGCWTDPRYKYYGGTSAAAPHVAGACALVLSVNPTLSHYQVRDIILNNVDEIPALNGLCVTGGGLNLYKAVVEAANQGYVLTVADDVNDGNSVSPNDTITYTISFDSNNLTNIEIVDYLPDEVSYPNSSDPNYNSQLHSYTWSIGPNDPNLLQLTVVVNNSAEPSGRIINLCFIDADEIEPMPATGITDVNCWGPGIIYMDCNATDGSNTGVSWQNAYVNLRCALERVHGGCGSEIRVAEGTYLGNFDVGNSTVTLKSTNPDNWGVVGNTIFRGSSQKELPIFDFNDNTGSVLNGFTITNSLGDGVRCVNGSSVDITNCLIQNNGYDDNVDGSGVYLKQSSANIKNCKIQNNGCDSQTSDNYGIISINSSLSITDCNIQNNATTGVSCKSYSSLTVTSSKIQNNDYQGIYCHDSNSNIKHCIIKDNGTHGIYCGYYDFYDPTVVIMNNWIFDNGTSGSYAGIRLYEVYTEAIVRNNTIVDNSGYGIHKYHSEPNVTNCIIWGNSGGQVSSGVIPDYSCIQNWPSGGTGNISSDPCFVDDTNDNYHLNSESKCIDTGDPNLEPDPNETDIDGEPRIIDGDSNDTEIVDIGADEFYWSPADFDHDEIVNFLDYAILANAWQTTPQDANYNPDCNLAAPNSIDNNDLRIFCEDWLWQPAWNDAELLKMMGCGMGRGLDYKAIYQAAPAEQQTIETEPAEGPDIETLKKLVIWLEEMLEDEEVKESVGEDNWPQYCEGVNRIIDSINAEIAQIQE